MEVEFKLNRIEGEAKIVLQKTDDGYKAHFVALDYRAVGKVLETQPLPRIPILASRICGVCCISHSIASLKAVNSLVGHKLDREAIYVLELAHVLQHIYDHLVHLYIMVDEDIKHLTNVNTNKFRYNALELFSKVLNLNAKLFGLHIHPIIGSLGYVGVHTMDNSIKNELKKVAIGVNSLLDESANIIDKLLEISPNYPSLAEHTYLTAQSEKLVNEKGEQINPIEFLNSRIPRDYGYIVPPVLKKPIRVGPLARLLITGELTLNFIRKHESSALLYHYARYLELKKLADTLEHLLTEGIGSIEEWGNRGFGIVEAPRGVLIHWYRYEDNKLKISILTPTAINTIALEKDIEKALEEARNIDEAKRIALMIARAYNPCLSCATCEVS